jgi:outer membrane receptor protein involved in Fe transport
MGNVFGTGSTWTHTGALAVALALCAPLTATAQIEEITVTARKREENLQNVPIAIRALTAAEIQRRGIVSLSDVVQQSASLVLDQGFSPQDQRIVVRGLSPTRGRQNVAVLQDGIDISSEAGIGTAGGSLLINPRLFDLERVEIVKGPQNALYGRSAFAGAINYITRKPGDTVEGRVSTDIGSQGQLEMSGSLAGPLSDTVSAGITGMIWSHDGFYRNAFTGNRMGDTEGVSVAGTVVWKPTDALSVTGRVENLNDEFGITPYGIMPFNTNFPIPPSAQVDPDGDGPLGPTVSPNLASVPGVSGKVPKRGAFTAQSSEDPRNCTGSSCGDYAGTDRDITRATLTVDYDLGSMLFTSLTHYATTETFQEEGSPDVSASTSPTPRVASFLNETDLFSQELRLGSTGDGPISWTVGGLYWNEDSKFLDGSFTCLNYTDVFLGFPNGPQPCGPFLANIGDGLSVPLNADRFTRDTGHWSAYGLVEWQFMDKWRVAFEARQTWEKLSVTGPDQDNGIIDPSGNLCLFFGAPSCPQIGPGTFPAGVFGPDQVTIVAQDKGGSQRDDFFAPKVTLTWTPTSEQLYYASYGQGYKPKGISLIVGGTGFFFDNSCGGPSNPNCVDPIAGYRFDQEKLDVYELGAKTSWLDRRLQLNGAVFFQDFKNKQVSTQITDPNTGILSSRTINAGKAEIWGLEVDLTWLATENLTLGLSYAHLDSEYTRFETFTTGVGTIAYAGNCTQVIQATSQGDRRGCIVSYKGNALEDAPEHALIGSARYQARLSGATDWFVEGQLQYQDERFEGAENQLVFPSYWLADLRVGLTSQAWDIVAYVDNAFDDDTVKTGFADGDIPTFFATNRFLNRGTVILPDKRSFGLRAAYRFGR